MYFVIEMKNIVATIETGRTFKFRFTQIRINNFDFTELYRKFVQINNS